MTTPATPVTQVERFIGWLAEHGRGTFADYQELWEWSTTDLAGFWRAVADFHDVAVHRGSGASEAVLAEESMPGAVWFPGVEVNFAEQALRHTGDVPAVVAVTESGERSELSRDELRQQVANLADWLRQRRVGPGDHVVGYLPNVTAAVVAFLATASVGATWSACSQEYSPTGAADRLGQLSPRVLFVADGYTYAGKEHDCSTRNEELRALVDSVTDVVWVDNIGGEQPADTHDLAELTRGHAELEITPVPFDHPLWVLYSSGTTGTPKGLVHGHGGSLLEQLKLLRFHLDLTAESRFCWFTSTSWMMWNVQVSGLLLGATIVLYDGSQAWPDPEALWEFAARERLTYLGTSAAHLVATHRLDADLGARHDLSSLVGLGSTGSPLPPSTSQWLGKVLPGVWLAAISGGTDVATAFAGGVRMLPARHGQMQARCLGVRLEAWDQDGHPVVDQVGELVVTRPMPSMPVRFLNDPDGTQYREAYFDTWPGTWRHGDWVTVTGEGGVVVHGRSDATMNRNGVRIGSAEIYEVLDHVPEVADALVVGVEEPDGGYWMPLFVVLGEGAELTEELVERIRHHIRTQVSPRHVPDEVLAVPALPHTLTGKRLEVPVKRLLQGAALERVANPESLDDPEALTRFVAIGEARRARTD